MVERRKLPPELKAPPATIRTQHMGSPARLDSTEQLKGALGELAMRLSEAIPLPKRVRIQAEIDEIKAALRKLG